MRCLVGGSGLCSVYETVMCCEAGSVDGPRAARPTHESRDTISRREGILLPTSSSSDPVYMFILCYIL